MAARQEAPVQYLRSPENGGPFAATPPAAQAAVAHDRLAAFHDITFRRRFGAAMLLVGAIAVSAGLLAGELNYATVVGAGVGTYGLYLLMR